MNSTLLPPILSFIAAILVCLTPLVAQEPDADEKAKIEQRDQLKNRLDGLVENDKLDEAAILLERIYSLEESIHGEAHADLLETLDRLLDIAEIKKDDHAVIAIRKRQQRVTEKLFGKDHYRTQDAKRVLSYAEQIQSFSAEDRARLEEATKSNSHLLELYQAGEYESAIQLASKSTEIFKSILGIHHPDYADSLNNLAELYRSTGDYSAAETLFIQSKELTKISLGENHPDYATSLNNLAELYVDKGEFQRATPLFLQALDITTKVLGEQHPDCVASMNNLAEHYRSIGDFKLAYPLLTKTIEIRRQTEGENNPSYAGSLNNLALLYDDLGDYDRAHSLFIRAVEIWKTVLGEDHPKYATGLNNLAQLYQRIGDYASAESCLVKAANIVKVELGEEHPFFAHVLSNLASNCRSTGDLQRAVTLAKQASENLEKSLGVQHPAYANSLSNLAQIYHAMGDHKQAETLFLVSMQTLKSALNDRHPDYVRTMDGLATHYMATNDFVRAEPLYQQALEISLSNLELFSDIQSHRQQVAMSESLRPQLDHYLSLATKQTKLQPAAYGAMLRWKGSVWKRFSRHQSLIDHPTLQSSFEDLKAVSSRLSSLVLRIPEPHQREAWLRQLDELAEQRESLERHLSLASAAYRQASIPVSQEHLRASLPSQTLLLDFLEYRHHTPPSEERKINELQERRLLVYIVRPDREVHSIDLGSVESLDKLVQTWRRDLGNGSAATDAARKLRKRIWEPIEVYLNDITNVYVSPDGILGQFPISALPGKQPGTYLLEDFAITMLPVPQGLLSMVDSSPNDKKNDKLCLVGGVDYEQVTAPEATADSFESTMLVVRGDHRKTFSPLPGTMREVIEIQSLARRFSPNTSTTILQGITASERAFATLAKTHRFLHIASHGFFAPNSLQRTINNAAPNRESETNSGALSQVFNQHPDLLSGLVFAGANRLGESNPEHDGILTAAEVQSLDLRGVDLAVLSACETGLGKSAGGEGIIGLQRSFQLAGARTTITSLWKVDDAATQALMIEFYRNLFERKLSKIESLRQAQLWLLNNPQAIEDRDLAVRGAVRETKPLGTKDQSSQSLNRTLPAYWAAFQLSGAPM